MKKLTLLFTTVALLGPNTAKECLADYKDMANQVETVADFWIGGTLNDTSNSVNNSLAEQNSLPSAAGRVGTNKASEFYSLESSGSGGLLLKGAPLPSRYHLEFDYYNGHDWFGDLRYTYKDYFQLRLLPRRLTHNLDNLTVYDFNPASNITSLGPPVVYNTNGNDVENNDAKVDDYKLQIDIDEYRLRLKVPNYPLHVYANGEVIKKKGTRQDRFLGGSGHFSSYRGRVRVTEARDVDQKTDTIVVGTNAHVGPMEFDVSHKERKFGSDLPAPTHAYDFGTREFHVIPDLKATSNTVKVHTSHTGRIFASATYSELKKTNDTSGAEAKNAFAYGEVSWVPTAYFSMATKFRHQKNDASAPATTVPYQNKSGTWLQYAVKPGVESVTDTGIISARYSLIPKTSVNLQYTRQAKIVDGQSAIDWGRPQRTDKDIYEFGFTNWAIPHVRTTAKLSHTRIGNDYGIETAGYEPVANDPDHTSQGTLGVTWMVSPRITAFANASVTKEDSESNRMFGNVTNANKAKALNQQYLMSLNFAINDKLSITPSYSYMSWERKRDLAWDYTYEIADPDATSTGDVTETRQAIDSNNTSKQTAQNYALSVMMMPTKRLNINGVLEYTVTKGNYDPTSPLTLTARSNDGVLANVPFSFLAADIGNLSKTDTRELGLRLDSEYDLGRGWGVGLDLRYVDWKDNSTDNPSDGIYYGGLFKVSKKLFY